MWLFSSKKTVIKIKWYLSENYTFKSLLKNRNYYLQKIFEISFAFDKESKRKLLNLISADSFMKNINVYDFWVNTLIIQALISIFF